MYEESLKKIYIKFFYQNNKIINFFSGIYAFQFVLKDAYEVLASNLTFVVVISVTSELIVRYSVSATDTVTARDPTDWANVSSVITTRWVISARNVCHCS